MSSKADNTLELPSIEELLWKCRPVWIPGRVRNVSSTSSDYEVEVLIHLLHPKRNKITTVSFRGGRDDHGKIVEEEHFVLFTLEDHEPPNIKKPLRIHKIHIVQWAEIKERQSECDLSIVENLQKELREQFWHSKCAAKRWSQAEQEAKRAEQEAKDAKNLFDEQYKELQQQVDEESSTLRQK